MLEHLKNMMAGLAFVVVALSVMWLSATFSDLILAGVLFFAMVALIYVTGAWIREYISSIRLVRDGDSGEGESC